MAQLENKNLLKTDGDIDVNSYLLEICNEFKPPKLQGSERIDPREEFHLPNAKRSRISDSDNGDQTNEFSEHQNLEETDFDGDENNEFCQTLEETDFDGEENNEFCQPQNLDVFKNPFVMFQNMNDLFSQLNEFLIPNSNPFKDLNPVNVDPLINLYSPVENSDCVLNDSCESTLFNEQYFPGYNNFINDQNPITDYSQPNMNNQLPEIFRNTSNFPIQKPEYPPFDESKSLLHELLTAPLKPKPPKNPSILHRLLAPPNSINSPNDDITVLSHIKRKAKETADEANIARTTDNNFVSGVKHKAVIDSAIGKLVMSFVLPTVPSTEFGPTFKTKKREQCSICSKRFENKYKLKIHMNCHTGNRPYICETCGASFLRSTNLLAHRRIHKPKEYQCPLCSKLFAHNSDRVVHIVCQVCITLKTMLEPIEDGWQCKECGVHLHKKSELERHVKKHKKSRICPVCLLDFSNVREHQLVSHVRTYHPTWLENFGL
ncbi:unnamed protein product [Meganyctiphanes norvegica]|uniref:C2H2-type domain-containing protein n=1 Tax=Meganyctiphanes norvegica TaxID=48144 RepID=A0AAV2Q530_MEGNR